MKNHSHERQKRALELFLAPQTLSVCCRAWAVCLRFSSSKIPSNARVDRKIRGPKQAGNNIDRVSGELTNQTRTPCVVQCPRLVGAPGLEAPKPLLLPMREYQVGMHKTTICCRFLHPDGNVVDLWMPQPIVYFTAHYHQLWKEWQRGKDAIDTSWDDWGKLDEAYQQEWAKEQARIDRKRKQEAEDRAKKR